MKKKSYSVVEIKDKSVREHLMKNYPGSQIYVRTGDRTKSKSKKDLVNILIKAGCSEKEICKSMHMFPSTIKKLVGTTVFNRLQTVSA